MPRRHPYRPRPGRAAAWTVLTLVLVLAAWTAWDLYGIRRDLTAGQAALSSLSLADLGRLDTATAEAAHHFDDAHARVRSSLPLRALGVVPGVGSEVDVLEELVGSASELGQAADAAARKVAEVLDRADRPGGRVRVLQVVEQEAARLARDLRRAETELRRPRLSLLGGAQRDAGGALGEGAAHLDESARSARALRRLLTGRRSLLLLAANNAEMAGGAGLALTAGRLEITDGALELADVVQASELRLDERVAVPEHLVELYDTVGVGLDLRSTTRSPDLGATGPVAAAVAEANGWAVDGVLVVDAVALAALAEVTGPVEAGGRTIVPERLLEELLHEGYRRADRAGDASDRIDGQHDVARAVVAALQRPGLDLGRVADELASAAAGRHVLAWSEDPEVQATWERLGVAGELPRDGLLVSFQNHAANKLDWYLRPEVDLDVVPTPSGDWRARLTLRMAVPEMADLEGATPYILGPDPGRHEVLLTVHLPAEASAISTPEVDGFHRVATDGGLPVRSFLVEVPLGQVLERTVELTLPASLRSITLVPSARLAPVPYTVDGTVTVDDRQPRQITWLAALAPGGRPSLVERAAAASVFVGAGALLALASLRLTRAVAARRLRPR